MKPKYLNDESGAMTLSPSSSELKQVVRTGGVEIARLLGGTMPNTLVLEAIHTLMMAILIPRQKGLTLVVPRTEIEDHKYLKFCEEEIAAVHDYNSSYYSAAEVYGTAYEEKLFASPSFDPKQNAYNQLSGVTGDVLKAYLSSGSVLQPNGSCQRIVSLLQDDRLRQSTLDFNDKNSFYRFLQKTRSQIHFTETYPIDEYGEDEIELLLRHEDGRLIQAIKSFFARKIPSVPGDFALGEYFLKISSGFWGLGVAPLETPAIKSIRGILLDALARKRSRAPSGIQLSTRIKVRTPNDSNPLSVKNESYFSPCLTMRSSSDGEFQFGQVADQVLGNGTKYLGSYWSRRFETKFLEELGPEKVSILAAELASQGYAGYFGTDFIQSQDGDYIMTVDGNARMNGNDFMYFARRALELKGAGVQSMYSSTIVLPYIQGSTAQDLIKTHLSKYKYNSSTNAGIILLPRFHLDSALGRSRERRIGVIFVNPSSTVDLFHEFFGRYEAR